MKKTFLLAAMAVSSLVATAQESAVSSAYSRYGVGLLDNRASGFSKGMAGTAVGMYDGRVLNVGNPASYARIDSLSFLFDVGMSLQSANLSANGVKANAHSARFDHLSVGFRLKRNLGVSFGVQPYSNVGYEITAQGAPIPNGASEVVTPTTTYLGDGGLYLLHGGVGYAPLDALSLGANVSYLWGTLNHSATTSYDHPSIHSLRRAYDAEVRSYALDLGAQYTQRLGRKHRFVLGATYGYGHQLNGTSNFYNQRLDKRSVSAADTLSVRNAYGLPHSFAVGLTWQWQNSLRVGLDYTRLQWGEVTSPMLKTAADGTLSYVKEKGAYTDQNKIALGAEYIRDPNGFTWSSRVRYRMGVSYASPYALIDGRKGPQVYTAALGVALPIITAHNARDNYSYLNLSAQYEHVKPQMPGQITERYFRLSIGLSFNQRWFTKWKVD
ncbi:hypothetical protein EII14_05985 [Alloprevotella sp. OH1205_COT-284]|uniref:hypothetical protein n=1 Tax=Alloprevotella sp. OH1205_COT-284 TaxID=2491043 RepID=UPI000F5D84E8|nr:hypothetical protein [Alloprevotella sp. OH1205_COT-284]RRD79682.1 hypothetical protein EII14_05985 [Alloprevotella sp. OH1205_COT-284]